MIVQDPVIMWYVMNDGTRYGQVDGQCYVVGLTETGGDHAWRFMEVELHAMCLSAKHDQIQATTGCQTTYICEKLLSLLCISRDRSDFEPETD